jgi:serine/threonine protein kinase
MASLTSHLRELALQQAPSASFFHTLDHARLVEGTELLTDDSPCPAFSCPEMLQEGSYSGRAADLWSLGILFYALLVGHYPFYDTDIQQLYRNIQRGYYMP